MIGDYPGLLRLVREYLALVDWGAHIEGGQVVVL